MPLKSTTAPKPTFVNASVANTANLVYRKNLTNDEQQEASRPQPEPTADGVSKARYF